MTTVRAQCPECGDVRLQIHDLTVVVGDDADVPSSYRFRCPSCDQVVSREATIRIVDLDEAPDGDIGPVVAPPSNPVTRRGAKKLPQA